MKGTTCTYPVTGEMDSGVCQVKVTEAGVTSDALGASIAEGGLPSAL